jgi:aconitate hydratase
MTNTSQNPAGPRASLRTRGGKVSYLPLQGAAPDDLSITARILLEMLLRRGSEEAAEAFASGQHAEVSVPLFPTRVMSQDHSGVPALLDLAAMRWALSRADGDPAAADLEVPLDLVIDHSVEAHFAGRPDALVLNQRRELDRNRERYSFLCWAARSFAGLRVVPPGRGIIHQIHLERLARVVAVVKDGTADLACPDTVIGTDSHTPMVSALGMLGIGVGGIEAEAALLGQAVPLVVPTVIGVRLSGATVPGVTATDVVLTLTEKLRQHGVVGAFLEFFGDGISNLSVQDRATISNMSPEYGATCALFPVDRAVLEYLALTRGDSDLVDLVERYTKAQGLFRDDDDTTSPAYATVVDFALEDVEPCMAGPRRPQDRVTFASVRTSLPGQVVPAADGPADDPAGRGEPGDGSIVIAAITSCTNTSNPRSMLAAGIVAREAVRHGLRPPPWVKTSLAPGSRVVSGYLKASGLDHYLDDLGFNVVGYGCTTCIGNSGPLRPDAGRAARAGRTLVAVLSGNRNFDGRIHPDVEAAYLASPPLVVAWALAGTILRDLRTQPVGESQDGTPVMLGDLWPDPAELDVLTAASARADLFAEEYKDLFQYRELAELEAASAANAPDNLLFPWDPASTMLVEPPFVPGGGAGTTRLADIRRARALLHLGSSVTTDHISPAGRIPPDSPAGRYLTERGVAANDFGTFGERRGNHEVLVRGAFSNRRLRNRLAENREGGWTRVLPDGAELPIHEAAAVYHDRGVPLIVLAGRDYGMGSSRDWAAKGPRLLGVVAVLARSFERIHRSNLVAMGIVPLLLPDESDALGLTGEEEFDLLGLGQLKPGGHIAVIAKGAADQARSFEATAAVASTLEVEYLEHGGVLGLALARLLAARERTSMDHEAIEETIHRVVLGRAPRRPAVLRPDTRLVHDLGFDSLGLLEVAVAIESAFGLAPIPGDSLMSVSTVGHIQELVAQAIGERR